MSLWARHAQACKRKIWYAASQMPRNVLFLAGECAAHQVNRIHSDAGNVKSQVGDLYSLKLVCRVANNANRLYRMLERMVRDELDVVERIHVPGADLARWQARQAEVLDHTVFREAQTRGFFGAGDVFLLLFWSEGFWKLSINCDCSFDFDSCRAPGILKILKVDRPKI